VHPRHLTPQDELRNLRRYRNTPKRDLTIGGEIDLLRKKLVRQAGAMGGLDEAWPELAPPELVGVTKLVKLTPGGVLHVECVDAPACFEMAQWTRGGGLALLRARCSVTLKDVRVSVTKAQRK
jgi:hypothetical protein